MEPDGQNAGDAAPAPPPSASPLPPRGDAEPIQRVRIEVSWRSIFRVLLGVLLAYVAVVLWPILKLLIVAILVAVAMYPVVLWARRQGLPRWVGLAMAGTLLVLVVVGCLAVIGPMVVRQAYALGENLPKLQEEIIAHLPQTGVLHDALKKALSSPTIADSQRILEQSLALAKTTVGGLFEFFLVIGFALYFLVDGPRALRWLVVFFPAAERQKIATAMEEMSHLIFAYVAGQFLVSTLCAVYVFLILSLLHVPMALLLGITAGILDILPVVGFTLAVCLAMMVGLTVSPTTAAMVFVLYGPYHLFENLYIIPRVYGRRLRLSPMVVPLALMAGGMVAGVAGAIAALPIVAVYPVVERLWLARKLAPDTVKEHESTN